MAKTQTILWTACPNGCTSSRLTPQYLQISVFVSPRLTSTEATTTLGAYPDFQTQDGTGNWARSVQAMTFKVETFTSATAPRATYDATWDSTAVDEVLWNKFFTKDMTLETFVPKDLSQTAIRTFSTPSVFAPVKQQYKTVAATPSLAFKTPTVLQLVTSPKVTTLPMVNVVPTQVMSANAAAHALASSATQNPAYAAFQDFHTPYVMPQDFVAPETPSIDFHKAASSLGSYPALLRRLGLVIDLRVPYTSAMAAATRIRVIPQWADGRGPVKVIQSVTGAPELTCRDVSQWTAIDLALTSTLPKRVSRFLAKSRDGHVRSGYLVARSITNPSADPVKLYNIDTDVAAARFMGTSVTAAQVMTPVVNPVAQSSGVSAAAAGEMSAPGEVSASAVSPEASTERLGLPGLGQPVIRMTLAGMGTRVANQFKRFGARETSLSTALSAPVESYAQAHAAFRDDPANVNYAEDLTRGYRVDSWDSVTRQWHKLCGREGTYTFGTGEALEQITWQDGGTPEAVKTDEGWVQLGAISAPEDVLTEASPSEMRIHESVFDWSGWSLSVPRPGAALSEPDDFGNSNPTRTFLDKEGGSHDIGHYAHPDLPLDVRFKVPSGELPRLRFGTTYRFRARAVDLAGNSVPFAAGSVAADPGGTDDSNPLVTRAVVHKRYEPVKSPTIVPVESPKPSESAHVVVVRSYVDPVSGIPTTEHSARHVTPPKVAITMAEAQGGLEDAATPGRPMSKAMWALLCQRDAHDFPMLPDGTSAPQATLPSPAEYLPDRYARGAAFKGLPGVASSTTSRTLSTSTRVSGVSVPLSSTKTTTVAALRVSFEKSGAPWYDRYPFLVQVNGVEATDARLAIHTLPKLPAWDETQRKVTVQLPKADEYTVQMSSYLSAGDLKVMGVHQWGMEQYVSSLSTVKTPAIPGLTASAVSSNPVPTSTSSSLPATANSVIGLSAMGQNWMLTPPQAIKLVHAVERPMLAPAFSWRAHMERKPGETHATLVDWMPIHGKSTGKIDVAASWSQNVDDPDAGAPKWGATAVSKKAPAFSLMVPRAQTTILNFGKSVPSMIQAAWAKVPSTGLIVNDGKTDTKRQRFHIGDTKHHLVSFEATYVSRYEEYFSDIEGLTFTRKSSPKLMHVPSSARPVAPSLGYIVPTFGWTQGTGTSERKGGGLRVYLERPWFSSGENERLAVVMYQPRLNDAGWPELKNLVTQWGDDPLWKSLGYLPSARPKLASFVGEARNATGLKLREYGASPVMVAAYDVDYDPEFGMWFADIVIDQGKAYFPFVKLALARYQQYSLSGYELSSVAVADFVQLTPGRFASVTFTAALGGGFNIRTTLSGQTYNAGFGGNAPRVTVQLEKRLNSSTGGWTPVGAETTISMLARTAYQIAKGDTRRSWAGSIKLTTQQANTTYRVVVREYEQYLQYGSSDKALRLVYADTIQVGLPQLQI